MQDQSAPSSRVQAPAPSPSSAGQPVRPVIPAAAAKRANASVIGMIMALLVSVAAFLPIVLMNPTPKSDGFRPNIDVSAVARDAAGVAGFTPVAPAAGDTFHTNYARWAGATGTGVAAWEVGYVTPKEKFIGLTQTSKANPSWLVQQTKSAPVTGTRNAGGKEWELHDTGKGEKSMVLAYRGTTVVLAGDAQLEEFAVLAAAVVKSLESNPAVTVSPSASPAP